MVNNYALECLHTACNAFSPDRKAQRGFAKLRRDMDEAKEPHEAIVAAMAAALADGIKHGNWPNA